MNYEKTDHVKHPDDDNSSFEVTSTAATVDSGKAHLKDLKRYSISINLGVDSSQTTPYLPQPVRNIKTIMYTIIKKELFFCDFSANMASFDVPVNKARQIKKCGTSVH